MPALNSHNTPNATPPPRLLTVMERLKSAYILWDEYHRTLPKTHRHSVGVKIDMLLADAIEAVSIASFLTREEKQPYVRIAIRKIDTVKVFLLILWETASLDTPKYLALSVKIDEIGRMLGGWNGQLAKNSPTKKVGEK